MFGEKVGPLANRLEVLPERFPLLVTADDIVFVIFGYFGPQQLFISRHVEEG